MSQTRKVVCASYIATEEFIVPKGLDLEDETQVQDWYIKWNILHITKADGTEMEVQPRRIESFDYKSSCDTEIIEEDITDDEEEKDEDEDEDWAAASGIPLNRLERGETHEGRICEKCSSGEEAVMIHEDVFMCEVCRNEMLGLK